MSTRLFPSLSRGRSSQLPRRRWQIRTPQIMLRALLGALAGAAIWLAAWWYFLMLPLWPILIPMTVGWFLMLPPPLVLGLDERGVALVQPGWTKESYLWIPQDRLARLEIRQGWLVASGTTIQQQGTLNWLEAASQAGATIPPWVKLLFQSGLAVAQIAAPVHLLDEVARDEIELWLYRQGK
jgi:hypothetical protein